MALRRPLLLVPVALALGACASLISFPDLGTEVSDAGVTTDAGRGDATVDGTTGDASRGSGSGSGSREGGSDAGSGSGSGAACGSGFVSCGGACRPSCALTLAQGENGVTKLTAGGGWVFWATDAGAVRAARADQPGSAITLCDVTEPVEGLAYVGDALSFAVGAQLYVIGTIAPDAGAVPLATASDAAVKNLTGNDASIEWSDSNGKIWTSAASPDASAGLRRDLNAPALIYSSLFATADRVYATASAMTLSGAVEDGGGSVFSIPLDGGTFSQVGAQTSPGSVSANGAYVAWINAVNSDASWSGFTLVIDALDGGRQSFVTTLATPPLAPVIHGRALYWVWPRSDRNSIEATALADGSTRPVVTDGGNLALVPPAFDATHMFWADLNGNVFSVTPIPTP